MDARISFMVEQVRDRLIAEQASGDVAGFVEECRARNIDGYGVFVTRMARHAWKIGPAPDGRIITKAYGSVLLHPAPATPETCPAAYSQLVVTEPYFPGVG